MLPLLHDRVNVSGTLHGLATDRIEGMSSRGRSALQRAIERHFNDGVAGNGAGARRNDRSRLQRLGTGAGNNRSATAPAADWSGSRGRARRTRTGLPVHERAPGHVSHSYNGPRSEGFGLGLLRLAEPTSFGSATADADLTRHIRTIHAGSYGTYGAPRVHAGLKADGLSVGRKPIARLMRAAGIAGVSRRRSAPVTTRQATGHHPASDLVRRNFMAERPNECGWPTSPRLETSPQTSQMRKKRSFRDDVGAFKIHALVDANGLPIS